MAINIRDEIIARYRLLADTIAVLEDRLNEFPEGRINIKYQKDKAYYYKVSEGTVEKYLSDKDDAETIKELVQKNYLKKVLALAKNELSELKKIKETYPKTLPEELYDQLPQARKQYAEPIVPGNDRFVRKWLDEPYEHRIIRKDKPAYISLKGDRVRSKSEMIIADRLWAYGIPYKYECPLMLDNEVIHPDFTVLRISDRKIVYHEHCGMMDDPKYVEDFVARVNLYNRCGIFLGDRLFLTFETSSVPLDVRNIDNIINMHFR